MEQLETRWVLSFVAGFDGGSSAGEHSEFVPGEILIGFEGNIAQSFKKHDAGPGLAAANNIVQDLGLHNGRVLMEVPAAVHGTSRLTTHWKLPAGADVLDVGRRLAARPGVAYAEPNYIFSIDASVPNDLRFDELWGLNNTGQTGGTADGDIDAPEAWDITRGDSSIVVGVIDTGVDYNHEDLASNMWVNPGEIAGNDIDDDGNGYVDDVYGWDFANDDNDPFDDAGHGSHTSGTIAAVGDNGIGVAGVAWTAQIMALKFLGAGGGGSTDDAIDAVNYATMMRNLYDTTGGTKGANIVLTSNSWGGGAESQPLKDAIAASGASNMLFVASAGNNGRDADASPSYPGAYDLDNIISVAATDHNDDRASFSNWGATSVDLAAPGVSVLSTTPGNSYSEFNGTSMAAPHVSGAAALAWSIAPTESYTTIRDAIFDSVDKIAAVDAAQGSTTPVATGGRLNAFGMLQELGMVASPSNPAAGSVHVAPIPPSDFEITFSYDVDDGTLNADGTSASDLQVNGVWASSYYWHGDDATPDPRKVTYSFAGLPISDQGVQTMHMPAEAVATSVTGLPAGNLLREMNATFRYDALLMEVTGTSPVSDEVLTLPITPASPQMLDVDFNESYLSTSLGIDDLILSDGVVAGAVPVDGDTVRYTIEDISQEGTLTVEMRAGAMTDVHGNPMSAFSANFDLDWDTFDYPTPLKAINPPGSLIYDPSISGFISYAGDNDKFQVDVDPGQKITVVVQPGESLAPMVTLSGPGVSPPAASSVAGASVIIQPSTLTSGGTYDITVASAVAGGTGEYTVQLILNAAVEEEPNEILAQDIDVSFIPLTGAAARGAVIGGIEDNGCTMPAAGYEACAFAPGDADSGLITSGPGGLEFKSDISSSGNQILLGADDEEILIRRKNLGFAFSLYGSTYDQIIIGSNGQLTFEWERRSGSIVNNSPSNRDLTDSPNVATIAPFWDDLDITPDTPAAVYWEVVGDQLIVQWDQIRFWDGDQPGDISFQAVLDAGDGSIQFNYKDLETGQPWAEGNSATAGIKDVGAQGEDRLLLAFNDGPNRFVGTGVSTKIAPVEAGLSVPVTPDYYAFSLAAGEQVTLALEHFGGNADLELQKEKGNTLATGVADLANADEVINAYVAATAGTYYAKVTGDTRVDYNLLITRGAYFDLENNSGPEPWNGIDPFQVIGLGADDRATVLGRIGGASGGDAVAGYYTDFSTSNTGPEGAIIQAGFTPLQITDISTFDFNSIDILMFNESNNGGLSTEAIGRLGDIEIWVEEGGVFLVHDRFVSDDTADPQSNPFLVGAPSILVDRDFTDDADLDVVPPGDTLVTDGPHGTIDNTTLDGGNSSNHGFVVGDTLSTAPNGTTNILSAGPDPDKVAAFSYPLGSGHVYYSTIPLDFYLGGDNNFNDPYATNMLVYGHSLVQPEADFYQIQLPTVPAQGGQLLLTTTIPGSGPSEPVNNLDPMIRVYDAAGNLLATDDNSGAGDNADLAYPLSASNSNATFYVEVVPSDAPMISPTKGPYILDIDVAQNPPPPGITLNKVSVVTGESNMNDSFTVVLDAEPLGTVTVPIHTTDNTEALLSAPAQGLGPAVSITLTFTPENYATPQIVDAHGQNDDVDDDDQLFSIVTDPASSTETGEDYHGLDPADLTALNIDNDTAGISVLPTQGLITTEAGGTDTFNVRLDSEPTDVVTIELSTSDPSEGQISGADGTGKLTLTFNSGNWDSDQTVTIVGQPDDVLDRDVPYTIITAPASSGDSKYDALDADDVSAFNADDEPAEFTTIEDFEDRNITEYTGDTSAEVSRKAKHDGRFGLQNVAEWMHRDDATVQVGPGSIISWWTRIAPREPVDGRAYMGFGATSGGTYSIVMAPNSGTLLLQKNVNYGYEDLASAQQTWEANHWYRFEVAWQNGGTIVGRLYDSNGTTLLNTVVGTDEDPIADPGGLAFRSFGGLKHFDTVQVVTTPGAATSSQTQPTSWSRGAALAASTSLPSSESTIGTSDMLLILDTGNNESTSPTLRRSARTTDSYGSDNSGKSYTELIDLALASLETELADILGGDRLGSMR